MRNGVVSVGFPDFEKAVGKFERHLIKRYKRIIAETTEIAVSNMKALVPVDTGSLRRSIDVMYANGGLTAIITVGSEIGIYIEFGTGIYAVHNNGRKDPWVYYSEELGRWVWTRGIHPQPFFHPSLEIASKHFSSELNKLK